MIITKQDKDNTANHLDYLSSFINNLINEAEIKTKRTSSSNNIVTVQQVNKKKKYSEDVVIPDNLTIESNVLIRIYQGGSNAEQISPFNDAIREFVKDKKFNIRLEYMTCEELRRNNIDKKWTPGDFVSWLLGADIHFIITHIHQGLGLLGQLHWDLTELYQVELPRLANHPGFPCGENLKCPVFTQDKFGYLEKLMPFNICNDTLRLEVTSDGVMTADDLKRVKSFIAFEFPEKNNKFCLKLPFVTNSKCSYPNNDLSVVLKQFKRLSLLIFGQIPYILFQKCMDNKKEYKIITYNQKALYVTTNTSTKGTAYSEYPHDRIKEFAEEAVRSFAASVPGAMCHGCFIRVDIFRKQTGDFVVNEFESLEAGRWTTLKSGAIDCQITTLQTLFWKNELLKFLD